jgi:hypothetical protein
MNKITIALIVLTIVFGSTGFGQASLIDDQVSMYHGSPLFSTPESTNGIVTVTVEAGAKDDVTALHFDVYTVDIEESSVIVDFLKLNQFGNPGVFDYSGLVINDLDFEPGYILLGVDVDTNMKGWDDSRLIFGDDYVGFNWQGLMVDGGTNLTALLDFGPNPIPIPPTLLLFATGIACYSLFRRKLTK